MNKLSRLSQKKILAMAGVTGTAMFGLIYTTLSSAVADKSIVEQPQVVEVKTPTVAIVTAAVDIPAQTVIQEGMLKLTDIPQDMVTTTTVRDISKLVGKVTRVDVLTDDVFTEKKVFHNIEQAGLTGMIPPDCRAISIGISEVTSVSGFINPGDHVDVMMVYERDGNIHSEIILQNVLLLAMGKRAIQTDKGILEGAVSGLASGLTAGVAGAAQAGGGAEKSSSTATLALHAPPLARARSTSSCVRSVPMKSSSPTQVIQRDRSQMRSPKVFTISLPSISNRKMLNRRRPHFNRPRRQSSINRRPHSNRPLNRERIILRRPSKASKSFKAIK